MDRRFLLAVMLMIAVLALPSMLFKRPVRPPVRADSTRTAVTADSAAPGTTPAAAPRQTPSIGAAPDSSPVSQPVALSDADTATLVVDSARYQFSSAGGVLTGASFLNYQSKHAGGGPAQLIRPGSHMLAHAVAINNDTVRLAAATHSLEPTAGRIRLSGSAGELTQTLDVTPVPGHQYLLDVRGEIGGLNGRGALLIVELGEGLADVEANSADNFRNYGVSVRRGRPESTPFRSVNPGERRELAGPFDWVAIKSKYFLGALLSGDSLRPQIGGAVLIGMPREGRGVATRMRTIVTMPVGGDGRFHYQLYLGPQTQRTLDQVGRRLDQAATYGWIFKGMVMPVAGWITRLFLWMHEKFGLSYGMVLVVFGILVRLVLWPLNQKAMKSQVAMMAVQPILKDVQTRYKNDPQRLQQEMMKVYKEHNVNPLGGCLPLLLPMPVLLALFFVFNKAIELRGTPFLWLPDLSLRDPLFITPIVMGLSMYALSKLSQAGLPPNPQTKMMTIFMPIMMTVVFLNFASGLNLYYAVSNIASLPQQYLINKSRRAEMEKRRVSPPRG